MFKHYFVSFICNIQIYLLESVNEDIYHLRISEDGKFSQNYCFNLTFIKKYGCMAK